MQKLKVIILAGGNSNRFGSPKPFLLFNRHTTFLEKIVNEYLEFGCIDIVLVINQNLSEIFCNTFSESFRSKIKVIYNSNSELGRFYSLKLGVSSDDSLDYSAEYYFIQNIDNPFTDSLTLQKLYDNRKDNAYVTPVFLNRGGHPILIPGIIIELIKKEKNINLNIKDFLSQFNKITVEIDSDKLLVNINTPDDYKKYFNQLA